MALCEIMDSKYSCYHVCSNTMKLGNKYETQIAVQMPKRMNSLRLYSAIQKAVVHITL